MDKSGEIAMVEIFTVTAPGYVRASDAAGYATLFTDDAVWCPPSAPLRHGPAQIEQGLAAMFVTDRLYPTFTPLDVSEFGAAGYIFGRARIVITPVAGGPASVAHSREWWQFREVGGVWKICRMMWNLAPDGDTT